ncbi:MAG: UDP-N-acetylmuramoyl-L-alanyl-D-glutamate--2,6-diaminopimelate ligase [Motiliproteus sp.]
MSIANYQMTLQQLLPDVAAMLSSMGHDKLCFSGLTIDSRKVKAGDLFLACQGATVNGIGFVDSAIKKGAEAVLINSQQTLKNCPVPVIPVPNLEQRLAEFGGRFYQQPSAKMQVVGITGTNGKTSCSHFIAQALTLLSSPSAVIGTNGYGFLDNLNRASHTTPDALYLQRLLAEMLEQGANNVVMEVSSHALDQGRVTGVQFDQAVFTNLTRDHLDYHGDMQSYGAAKKALFSDFGVHYAVLNLEDAYAAELIAVISGGVEILGYGIKQSQLAQSVPQIWVEKQQLSAGGIEATLNTPAGLISFSSTILGGFNLSNLMATVAVLLNMDFSPDAIAAVLGQLQGVDGRMQPVAEINDRLIVVDYAHTPDALEKALLALRNHCRGSLWCVFGCGGDRDRGKRSEMAAIAEKYADRQVVTSDNPRSEPAEQIIEEILAGFSHRDNLSVEGDRRQAIALAVAQAQAGDVILVAGKGHEDYQEIGGVRYPYSDSEVIRSLLSAAGGPA